MPKEKYFEITYDYTVAVAEVLTKQNQNMSFTFISGVGTDETEKSRINWRVVKGKAENVLRNYPFKTLSLFRPAYIRPLEGVTASYTLCKYFDWLIYPIFNLFYSKFVITSEELGKAMINSVFQKEKVKIIENEEIKKMSTLQV